MKTVKVVLRFNGTINTGSTEEANDGITSQFLSGNPFTGKNNSFVGDYDASDIRNDNAMELLVVLVLINLIYLYLMITLLLEIMLYPEIQSDVGRCI